MRFGRRVSGFLGVATSDDVSLAMDTIRADLVAVRADVTNARKSLETKLAMVQTLLGTLSVKTTTLIQQGEKIMATEQEMLGRITAGVSEERDRFTAFSTMFDNLKAELRNIVSGELSPERQAKFDEAMNAVTNNVQTIQTKIDENTTVQSQRAAGGGGSGGAPLPESTGGSGGGGPGSIRGQGEDLRGKATGRGSGSPSGGGGR